MNCYSSEFKSSARSINLILIVLLAIFLSAVTMVFPVYAESKHDYIQESVSFPQSVFFKNPERVRLGITPTGWSNSDDLTIDTMPPIPYQQILSEMAFAGYKGTQNAPKFPNKEKLKQDLLLRGLTISEPWVGTYFTIGDTEDSKKHFDEQLEFMKYIGGSNIIVVAELGGAVHQQSIYPLDNRPKFTEKQWNSLFKGLNELGKKAHDNGFLLCYHPHIGTGVETVADIDKLMQGTDPNYVKLLLDTGHLYYAGADPIKVTQAYGYRIKHVHLKNVRQAVLDTSIQKRWSFLESIRGGNNKDTPGIFTVPGDLDGAIDFIPIFQALADADYEGWLIVEAEQDPTKANPLKYALIARSYLRQATHL